MKGRANQDDQACLDEDQIDAGFVLTCVASPMSDCTVETHAEDALYWGRPSAQRVPAVGAYPTVS